MNNKKLALVTGATGAIGRAIARRLAEMEGLRVMMIVRNEEKALRVMKDIQEHAKAGSISYMVADLSVKKQVFDLAAKVQDPVHILVNNAAITPVKRTETAEGIEMQFAANVLGYYWMTEAFTPHLKAGAPSRVVNVASYWAGGLDLSDLEFRHRSYDNDEAYRQSKQANRMLTVVFAKRLEPFNIIVNSCHPGDVNSVLSNSMGFGGHETPDQGAATPVWLATSQDVAGITGKYFAHRREASCEFSKDTGKAEKLFQICASQY
ncbi:MAG: SDR family NAD(P)-dependent oxidoreductase [Bacteroidales bacterium]|jgi:retinol dehydrogenase-13|nr:SDR family NAD(P)-dependent oxidoreductase [Bacteroidales bacterium]